MPNGMKVDDSELRSVLDQLGGHALAALNRRAAQHAALDLRDKVKDAFVNRLPAAARQGKKYDDALVDAVRVATNANNPSTPEFGRAQVSILGVRSKSSMTFMAKFFEGGTRERGTEVSYKRNDGSTRHLNVHGHGKSQWVDENWKPHRKGSITALNFLADTARGFKMDGDVRETLENYIEKIGKK